MQMRFLPLAFVASFSARSGNHPVQITATMVTTRSASKNAEGAKGPTKRPTKKTPTAKKIVNDESGAQRPWYHVFTKGDPEYDAYMANEWGFEKRGDVALFEKISLEGAQSGLSWLTILRKREAYRRVFHGFDIEKVASMTDADIERIMNEEGDSRQIVVRHKGKIESVINNARCIAKMRQLDAGDKEKVFDSFLWSFVDDKPILNRRQLNEAVSKSDASEAMSTTLKKLGFRFVGPTTCYAMMQGVGMVIDHPIGSPEWEKAFETLKLRSGGYQDWKS